MNRNMARHSSKPNSIMKKTSFRNSVALIAIMFLAWLNPSLASAQQKISDKEIVGVWVMTSMMYEGENRNLISDNYTQIKVYRANGEYACAEIAKGKGKGGNNTYIILPHEYGTYYLKNGQYSEMGREETKWEWIDKVSFKGKWKNRRDQWRKVVDMPEELTQHIVDKCKAAQSSPDNIQKMIKKHIFAN